LIAAGMTATDERAEEIDFSIVYIEMGLKVIVPIDSTLSSFDQLDGKKIAVQASTTADIYAQNNYKNAQLLQFTKPIDAVNAVMSGNADAAIIDLLPAEAFVNENPTKIKLMDGLLSKEQTAMGVRKNSDDFLALVNEVLQQSLDDGTFDAIYQKHMDKYTVE
jgi:polar amino acid transport system substrate-binding protein